MTRSHYLRRLNQALQIISPWTVGTQRDHCRKVPSAANALDIFEGEWISRLPDGLGGGDVALFEDQRIIDLITAAGGVEGKAILELGPMEGAHSAMLQQAGAVSVLGLEAGSRLFLRCLVVKEALNLDRVRFMLGDFNKHLAQDASYDMILASGVIYHSANPVELLVRMCRAAPQIAIWSHYYEADPVRARYGSRFDHSGERVSFEGIEAQCYRHNYGASLRKGNFCGGVNTQTRWMDWDSWLRILDGQGFDLQVLNRSSDHPNGPQFTGLAVRRA
jgi:hypothetical protein